MSELTIWERLHWWLTWRIWRPLRGQCSWCGTRLTNGDLNYGTRYARGVWACQDCTDYPEG